MYILGINQLHGLPAKQNLLTSLGGDRYIAPPLQSKIVKPPPGFDNHAGNRHNGINSSLFQPHQRKDALVTVPTRFSLGGIQAGNGRQNSPHQRQNFSVLHEFGNIDGNGVFGNNVISYGS